ncbi:response regulator [Paenibacillus pasadenensis]|uniref:response regulator n=1 Tax=Paenibacillus pasadenensis TaxID=217090 RepID=UPI00203FAFA1|nr:response regulator [Paenibacillus pasadenensis]MCM3749665.1 response regulator [Paenibacillus pasadenensis]
MWTVLLVEDEAFVRRSVRNGIPWEENGFTVIGECSNGEEAMEWIEKETPDLVVTDIRMPVMDGIQLLQQASERFPRTRFIMLTVMNDFEHAQQALQLGASGYVLKLYLTPEKMAEALLKVRQQLERDRQMSATLGDRLRAMLFQVYEKEDGDVTAEHGVLPIDPTDYPYLRVILHEWDAPDAAGGEISAGNRNVLACSRYGMTLLLSRKPFVDAPAYPHVSAKWAFPDTMRNISLQLFGRLDELWHAGKRGGYLLAGQKPIHLPAGIPWPLEKAVLQAFEQKHANELEAGLRRIWDWMTEQRLPAASVRLHALRLLRRLSSLSGQAAVEDELEAALSHEAAGQALARSCLELLNRWRQAAGELCDHPDVNRVILYMHEHFSEDISLALLSGIAMMDDKYLSVLFKKKMGCNLTQYLLDIRLKHACRLLRETDAPISEIAAASGMPNENYFSRVFKRETGITPSAYRQR